MPITSAPARVATERYREANGQTYRGPFAVMTVLFFMWGFMTVFNDILIPRFKTAFALNYFQALLPPIQGRIADATHILQISLVIPLIAYAYVAFYGWKGYRLGRKA